MKTYLARIFKKQLRKKKKRSLLASQEKYFTITAGILIYPAFLIHKLFFMHVPSVIGYSVFALITLGSIVYASYLIGIMIPLIEHLYNRNTLPYEKAKQYFRTIFKKAGILIAFAIPPIVSIFLFFMNGDSTNPLMYLLQRSVIVLCILGPVFVTYQYLYKPARAGRLPKWVYRWLGRTHPRIATPLALSDDVASVESAEYTVVDDAPERTEA